MNNFNEIPAILLVYSNTKIHDGKERITYNVICDVDNIDEDIETIQKIIARLEILKQFYQMNNKSFDYNIKSRNWLEKEIIKKDKNVIKKLADSTLIYSKENAYDNIIKLTR